MHPLIEHTAATAATHVCTYVGWELIVAVHISTIMIHMYIRMWLHSNGLHKLIIGEYQAYISPLYISKLAERFPLHQLIILYISFNYIHVRIIMYQYCSISTRFFPHIYVHTCYRFKGCARAHIIITINGYNHEYIRTYTYKYTTTSAIVKFYSYCT